MDPFILYITITAALVIAIVLLVVWQVRHHSTLRRLTYQVYDYTLKKAEDKASKIVNDAQDESRRILTSAEEQANKFLEERKRGIDEAQQAFEKKLNKMLEDAESRFAESADTAVGEYKHLTEDFKNNLSKRISGTHETVNNEMNKLHDKLNATTDSITKDFAGEMKAQIDDAFAKAEQAAEEYRKAKNDHVNERIATLVERTSEIAIGKALSAEEHGELVKEALERAKEEGAFE